MLHGPQGVPEEESDARRVLARQPVRSERLSRNAVVFPRRPPRLGSFAFWIFRMELSFFTLFFAVVLLYVHRALSTGGLLLP